MAMAMAVNQKTNQAVLISAPSVLQILRYVEWTFLGVHTLRGLFPVLYGPIPYPVGSGDYLVFGVFILFAVLSFKFPLEQPLWQKRAYIWVEIICLLLTRLLSHWGLDLFLLLVLVKGCFLLSQREVILTAIGAGLVWQAIVASYFMVQLSQPLEQIQAQVAAAYNTPTTAQLIDVVLNSATIFIAASSLIILFCFLVIAERNSRQREVALRQEVEILVADLERARIARDIHDSLGHTLTSLDVQVELAQCLYQRGSDQVKQALDTSRQLASQSIQEVRQALAAMREGNFDLATALSDLLEPFRADPAITIDNALDLPELPLHTGHQLFCILKEALENIRKHSQAKLIQLQGQADAEQVMLSLIDNGVGFDLNQPMTGFGLRGMQERAQLLGGTLRIHSQPGKGTTIELTLPRRLDCDD